MLFACARVSSLAHPRNICDCRSDDTYIQWDDDDDDLLTGHTEHRSPPRSRRHTPEKVPGGSSARLDQTARETLLPSRRTEAAGPMAGRLGPEPACHHVGRILSAPGRTCGAGPITSPVSLRTIYVGIDCCASLGCPRPPQKKDRRERDGPISRRGTGWPGGRADGQTGGKLMTTAAA